MQVTDLKKAILQLQDKIATPMVNTQIEPNRNLTISLSQSGSPDSHFWMAQESSYSYVQDWLRRNLRDKVFLDCTCGAGERVVQAAEIGCALAIGLSRDEIAVGQARAYAKKQNCMDKTVFLYSQSENTGLPNESIDVIILDDFQSKHDFSFTFPELRRILKPGGKILFLGTLDYNPFVKVRALTKRRQKKDQPTPPNVVEFSQEFFQIGELRYWHLLSTGVAYISNFKIQSKVLSILNPLDHYLAKIPGIRRLAWQFSLELRKKR